MNNETNSNGKLIISDVMEGAKPNKLLSKRAIPVTPPSANLAGILIPVTAKP